MATQLNLPATTTRHDHIRLGGGLDLLTPILSLKPGYVRDALNWEQSVNGGYTRITGYERYDGRPSPSQQGYQTLSGVFAVEVATGATITGATSGATGIVLSVQTVLGVDVVAYGRWTGTFVVGEQLQVGGISRGAITLLAGAGPDASYAAEQLAAAADLQRTLIGPVPGAGPVRGGFVFESDVYAFRNNVGNTALVLHRATAGGWVAVGLGQRVAFTAGSTEYVAGETLTQGGVSATILHVALRTGTWLAGTAAGSFAVGPITGGNFAAGAATGGGVATLSGAESTVALLPGGRVDTKIGNFGGRPLIYGWDGVNPAWEFDGTTLALIETGNSPDAPQTGLVHKDHLWLAFGDNLQNSGIAAPFAWSAVSGSAAYRLDGYITALLSQPGDQSSGVMSVATEASTSMIYGSSAADFRLVPFEQSAGARLYGAQRIGGQSLVFGNIGVFSLSATQAFGNFQPASMTLNIRPFTQTRRQQCRASLVQKEKSQYRVFFADGYGLYLTMVNGKLLGTMPVLFPHPVFSAWQGESSDDGEQSFIGGDSGYVYQLDAGTSHDGEPIESFFTLTFANQGGARFLKRYRRATIEAIGEGYCDFSMTYEVGYGGADRPQGALPVDGTLNLSQTYWDAFTWDLFRWDGRLLAPSTLEMNGTGENIALRVASSSVLYASLTLNSIILDYSPRRVMR